MENEKKQHRAPMVTIIKRALLVEDYIPCQKIMTYYLRELGYEVDLTADGSTAIKKVNTKIYDLIIEDLGLGNVSGKEVIQSVRNSTLNIGTPLLIWSAYVNKNDEEKYLNWGADGVLIKVCQIKDLKKAIDKCFLKTRYQRKFYYQLQTFKKKCEQFFVEIEGWKDCECINRLKYTLHEVLVNIEEHQHWIKLVKKEDQIS